MAKQKETPTHVTLTNSKQGKEKTLEIGHAKEFLIVLAKIKKDREWSISDGYVFENGEIVKK